MKLARGLAIGAPLLLGGAAATAYLGYRNAMADARRAWRAIASRAKPAKRFHLAMLAGLPDIAQRYFRHAIEPGTRLRTTVELEMQGRFRLGEQPEPRTYAMRARQILRPPFEFVWMPKLTSGRMTITGSDALADGEAWTRFWLMRLVPVANAGTSPDMLRSAAFRAAMEGVWAPASLLPQNGVEWVQIGPESARVTINCVKPTIVLDLTIDPEGALIDVVGERWSNANPQQRFQLQPFGGTVEGEASFGGFTIPARIKVGNHFGTAEYVPFFQAEVTRATYR